MIPVNGNICDGDERSEEIMKLKKCIQEQENRIEEL
jgi:hypothetical protein